MIRLGLLDSLFANIVQVARHQTVLPMHKATAWPAGGGTLQIIAPSALPSDNSFYFNAR